MLPEIVESAQEELQASVADVVSGEVSVEAFEDATDTTELFLSGHCGRCAGYRWRWYCGCIDTDDDGDGVADGKDAFSLDATET